MDNAHIHPARKVGSYSAKRKSSLMTHGNKKKKKRNNHTLRGRDGILLKKGEAVWGCRDRKKWIIEGFYKSNKWPVRTTEGIQLKPEWLTHTPPEEFAIQQQRAKRFCRAIQQAGTNLEVLSGLTKIPRRVLSGWTQFFWCKDPGDLVMLCLALDMNAVWLIGDREEDRKADKEEQEKRIAKEERLRKKEAK